MKSRIDRITLKQQMYIEIIGELESKHGHAHVSEIARLLDVSKPSVVQMLERLKEASLIKRVHKDILLTAAGRRIAGELDDRQTVLHEFMVAVLGMDARQASEEACQLEHIVSPAFLAGLRHLNARPTGNG
ncbi:MAG: metal-dependent transcriptional regulator [Kiritimatiellae bacterium]|nr:metal-dependent transcriptional regulator [Kiritimatiellia bacterium]